MSDTLSITEAKHLLQLCKTGRLFDVQNWIASGKSLRVPSGLRDTPLTIALNTGFHSLVELLVGNEETQDLKNQALRRAVSLKRLDFIELLVSHRADISSVPFIDVLNIWEPTIIRYFIDQGADLLDGSPFAIAFGEKIRTAIGPWKECREKFPEVAPQLQEQADRALRHFCFEGELKWVSLLVWAGADPRSIGPTLDDDEDDENVCALKAAAYCKKVEILKRLKPDPERDDMDQLLTIAGGSGHADVVHYLLELGAKPNDKPNGGSTALEHCLEHFRFESFMHDFSSLACRHTVKASKYSVSQTRDTIKSLIEHGALWRPDTSTQISNVRRSLLECEPDVTLELVERLTRIGACNEAIIREVLRTPAMKKHLEPLARRFVSLGFDVRTPKQKTEDVKREEASRQWALRELAFRYDRKKIYEEIWSEPIQHVAKRYKLSDVGLAKVCRKLNIPRPGRGYWAKKAAGQSLPQRPQLPKTC